MLKVNVLLNVLVCAVVGIATQTQNISIPFIQCRLNVFDVGPTLCKCYTNVLCLLGRRIWQQRQHLFNSEVNAIYTLWFDYRYVYYHFLNIGICCRNSYLRYLFNQTKNMIILTVFNLTFLMQINESYDCLNLKIFCGLSL